MQKKVKTVSWGSILLGALLIVVGICFICFNNTFDILAVVMGILLAVFGVIYGVLALTSRSRNMLFAIKIVVSILAIVGGIVTAVVRSNAIGIISNVFFLLLIVDGAFKLHSAISHIRLYSPRFWIMITMSVVIIVYAFLMAKLEPTGSLLSVLTGVLILLDGIMNYLCLFLGYTKVNIRIAQNN